MAALALMISSQAQARNPFQSFLPQKSKPAAPDGSAEDHTRRSATLMAEPPKVEIKIEPPKLILSGLIWNSDQPQAIVDGHVVGVSDKVKGVKITAITARGVEGDFNGIKVHLKP